MYWGVDSFNPADNRFRVPEASRRSDEPDSTTITLFDYVTRRMDRRPAFWGRYLNRNDPLARAPGSSSITLDEVRFLHGHGCRVLLVYNGSSGRSGGRLTGGRHGGEQAAAHADAICRQLGVPSNVAIYADVENWAGDVGWFRGWYETLQSAGRRSGVYGRPVRMVENPAHPARQYGTTLSRIPSLHVQREARDRIRWETGMLGRAPRRVRTGTYWGDELAQTMADVVVESVLQRGSDPFRDLGHPPLLVWSNEPRRVMGASTDAQLDGADIPPEFVPAEPPHASGLVTAVWQYLQNALFRSERGLVDMNLANGAGYASMWAP